ncbi:UDP-N-acetylglucosamine 2-epimerase [Corynebacterium casei]|uniref:UDP-N-acetylglucosamine 2-epimerase n=1 Tax=Corynebacterium casei TaxID=160386 RepID=UPI0023F48F38|nr:UDP-N-acetylglucosamine 2-epimerase [Corynebacterium casei]
MGGINRCIKVVHLEASLRTRDIFSVFPEGANRKIIGQLASLYLVLTGVIRESPN